MKSIFLTLGWQTTAALSAVVRHGLSRGDEVLAIIPHIKDTPAKKAISELQTFIKNLDGVEFEEIMVDISDLISAVAKIKSYLDKRWDRRCIVNLSGGMRVLVLITYLACLLTQNRNLHVEIETENRKYVFRLPTPIIEYRLTTSAFGVLKTILNYKKAAEIRKKLNMAPSTLHVLLNELEKRGLIIKRKAGKTYEIELTEVGELILKTQL